MDIANKFTAAEPPFFINSMVKEKQLRKLQVCTGSLSKVDDLSNITGRHFEWG